MPAAHRLWYLAGSFMPTFGCFGGWILTCKVGQTYWFLVCDQGSLVQWMKWKRSHYINCNIFETAQEFWMEIASVIEDVIGHIWRKFYKISLLHAKMVRVTVSKDAISKWTRHCVFAIGQNLIRLHFVEEKAKANADYYVNQLLPKLVDDCHQLFGQQFIFQQDGAPAHAAKLTQYWLAAHCSDLLTKTPGHQIAQTSIRVFAPFLLCKWMLINCDVCRGPFISALDKTWCPDHFMCANPHCRVPLVNCGFVEEEGQLFCEKDYELYFAPHCGKCARAIVGVSAFQLHLRAV